jgi:hypothetical protein
MMGLCRYINGTNGDYSSTAAVAPGNCVATKCADMSTAKTCNRYNTNKGTAISCAWDSKNNRCLEYGGNCTVLPDKQTCTIEDGCEWMAANQTCNAGKNHHLPGVTGEGFNCSFEHWRYPDKLVLGTPKHYYHILEAGKSRNPSTRAWTMAIQCFEVDQIERSLLLASFTGVSIWTNNVSASNLGYVTFQWLLACGRTLNSLR